MKLIQKIRSSLELNYFGHLYLALERRDNERGFGPYIHFFDENPGLEQFVLVMKFDDFIEYLMQNPVEDLYFFGPLIDTYKTNWRFKLYVKNRGLEKYFVDTSDDTLEIL